MRVDAAIEELDESDGGGPASACEKTVSRARAAPSIRPEREHLLHVGEAGIAEFLGEPDQGRGLDLESPEIVATVFRAKSFGSSSADRAIR